MIQFENLKSGEEISKSYKELVLEYLQSPLSEEKGGFVLNMMIFLDHMSRKTGFKFQKITDKDWYALHALNGEMAPGVTYAENEEKAA